MFFEANRKLALAFMVIFLTLHMAGCSVPGEGAKADAWYKKAELVIVALKKYHENKNHYPTSLQELIPDYLPESVWRKKDDTIPDDTLEYKKIDQSYELKFSYTGPGMNHCFYHPDIGKWECFGYY